jgi:hypothetical protein
VAECDKPLIISSSTPPEFAPEQEALFREVLVLMNEKHVPYVVSGAFALQTHTGIWRDTKDLDLFLPAEEVPRALQYLDDAGFATEVTDPVWLAKAWRNEYFVDFITGMSNAVITVDRSWIERGAPAMVAGVPSRVLAAEELIVSKLFVSFRERFDGADIVHLIHGTRGRLDWRRMLDLVDDHWEILLWVMVLYEYIYPACSDFIPRPVWDELLRRLQRRLDHPDHSAAFRGSLIDERMFAIDIHEWGMENILERYRAARQDKIPVPAKPAA